MAGATLAMGVYCTPTLSLPSMNRLLLAVAATTLLWTPAAAQQINNPPQGTTTFVLPFGSTGGGNGTDFGQTFTAPVGFNTLDQFSFWFGNGANGSQLYFRAHLAVFHPATNTAGPDIFQSALVYGTSSNTLQHYVFNTGGSAVTAGVQYFAYVDASEYVTNVGGRAFLGSDYVATPYAGGTFCYNNSINGNAGNAQTIGWVCGKSDIGFTATFSQEADIPPVTAAPEPATLTLLGSGIAAAALFARRRKTRAS